MHSKLEIIGGDEEQPFIRWLIFACNAEEAKKYAGEQNMYYEMCKRYADEKLLETVRARTNLVIRATVAVETVQDQTEAVSEPAMSA